MNGNRVLIVHDGRILGIHEPDEVCNPFAYPQDARACPERIAAAAPWLLEACEKMSAADPGNLSQMCNAQESARAAISKATAAVPAPAERGGEEP